MELNTIQEKINKKAEERLQKDLTEAVRALDKNPILRGLRIKIGEESVKLYEFGHNGIFCELHSGAYIGKKIEQLTNYETIRENLLKEYVEQETNALFDKIDEIKDFIENT